MPSLTRRVFRSAKRRIKQGMRDQRTFNLCRTACRLLAHQDHDHISVARIARETGISVGAFYERFPSKDAFLGMVVSDRLHGAREHMLRELDPERWRRSSAGSVTHAIVEEMMRNLHGSGAGVVRAALKRGYLDRNKLEPLIRYRAALADAAVALLAHRAKGARNPARVIRSAMQMAEATALDALLHEAGTLRPGSRRMADLLSAMILGMLGLPAGARENSTRKGDELPERGDDDGDEAMLDMPIEEMVALPIPEPADLRARSARRKAVRASEAASIKTARPKHNVAEIAESPEPPARRRRRPSF